MRNNKSPRQQLRDFAGIGDLREAVERMRLGEEATELLITIVLRYCENPPRKKTKTKIFNEK